MNLSIVIQAHERKEILEKTLIGLYHQEISLGKEFEVIVIDNKSKQDLRSIVSSFAKTLDIQYVGRNDLEHPFAIASGRNLGMRMAKHEGILIMDSDIYLPPTLIDSLIDEINNKNHAFLMTAKRVFIDSSDFSDAELFENKFLYKEFPKILSESNYYHPEDNRFSHGEILKKIEQHENPWAYFYGMFTCFTRSSGLAINGYDESFDGHWGYEDIDFAYRLYKQVNPECMIFDGDVVYHQEPYRENQDEQDVTADRLDKANNPNWEKICNIIPGFSDWKSQYYKKIAGDIVDV